MAEEIRHDDGRIEHPSVRHEKTDASFPWILGLILGAAFLGALIFYLIWLFFNNHGATLAEERKSPFPLAPKPSLAVPPSSSVPR